MCLNLRLNTFKLNDLTLFRMEDKAKETTSQSIALVDRHQANSTKLLRDRTHDVYRLKTTLERAIRAQMEEFSSLAVQRNRLMEALAVLQMPESIATECIERRSRRADSELVKQLVLIGELKKSSLKRSH